MSSKTKIVVLRMKEIIYTGIFLLLGILLISLFLFMFRRGKRILRHPLTRSNLCTRPVSTPPPSAWEMSRWMCRCPWTAITSTPSIWCP